MLRLCLIAFALLAAAGCAAPRAQKMSFGEAFGTRPPQAPKPLPQAPPQGLRPVESDALGAELARFAHQARELRARARRGSRMPAEQQQNWVRLVAVVDEFLTRPVERTAAPDVIRARVAAEAELELDAKAYGDVPAELAEQVLDRVNRLSLRMSEVRRLDLPPAPVETSFSWPIEPVKVTSAYGRRWHPVYGTWRAHYGVDLDAYSGQLVMAAGKGTVVNAGWSGAHGNMVEIRHAGNVLTRYSHLSVIVVQPGNTIDKGDPVGLAGNTGVSTGPHLHFEFWRAGRPRDPLDELPEPPRDAQHAAVPRS